ncbi:HlyD family efflux transporter periplasmic adaptor subunit [Phyllobacterium sp. SYP-B3895]|uniref:HlyD family secretion protein n=1 Tax=Phyllobacterium sp. SYP-B3895 TaxID=2663240 RepID=UPI001299ECAE|nr:HlyD family secretion protein [Phyllobacterium sp. SYP-B3895]MRG57763.1 HlyD family efflux transporter periplasmic adaptor subunit [Phyllobacterium sp. SYP-B3895]
MAWLNKTKQLDVRSANPTNVTALAPSTQQTGTLLSRAKALLIPTSAILIAISAVVGATSNWDSVIANRSVQSTNDAAVYADMSTVSARISGTVEAVSISDYAKVKAGDMLFLIDRAPYAVAVRSSQAKVEAARAQLQNNASQRTFQLAQIDVAVAQEQAATADEVQTGKELERQARLAVDGTSSAQNLEKATAAHHRALANLKMSQASVAAQQAQLDVLAKLRDGARANVDTAEAELAEAELELSHCYVRAPFDGVVAKRNVQLGMYVTAGTNMISLVPLPHVYVLANFKENQLANVREGQSVDVSVDMFPGENLRGTVSKIAPASGSTFALLPADNASGNFTKVAQRLSVRVELDPSQRTFARLRPGMSVVTSIVTR